MGSTSEITGFEGGVEHHGRVERLVDVPNQMQQVSGHKSSLEASSVLISGEYAVAPVEDIDSIDILLVLGHSLKGEIRVIGAAL